MCVFLYFRRFSSINEKKAVERIACMSACVFMDVHCIRQEHTCPYVLVFHSALIRSAHRAGLHVLCTYDTPVRSSMFPRGLSMFHAIMKEKNKIAGSNAALAAVSLTAIRTASQCHMLVQPAIAAPSFDDVCEHSLPEIHVFETCIPVCHRLPTNKPNVTS